MTVQFYPVSEKLCNVIVNGKESNWYVEKENGWYQIQWGKQNSRYVFRKQSWFSSQDKSEIKDKLQQSVNKPVEIMSTDRGLEYVYQYS